MTSSADSAQLIQGSPEWLMARCGKITASKVADIVSRTKTGYSASRDRYKQQLAAERLTGDFTRTYTNDAMLWGIENEPIARELYANLFDVEVVEVGLIEHPRFDYAAASPDGLVGTDGLIEIKCLTTINHMAAIHDKKPPENYLPQVHWQMACTGAKWCDLTLFDPRMPDALQMYVFRIHRSPEMVAHLENEVEAFNKEVDQYIETLWSNKQ